MRAYDAYSRKVGTHEDTEGQIYIEPQGMCVMAGIGLDDGKAQQALKLQQEQLKTERQTQLRQQRGQEKENRFALKQKQRKAKHRGK